jgi:magnesium transporter
MRGIFKKMSRTKGLPPGTLIHIGEKKTENVRVTVIDYDEKNIEERELSAADECVAFKDTPTVTWINIDGLHDTSVIEKIGTQYDLHPLVLEDILNTAQRPKFEDFDGYIFLVLKMFYQDEGHDETVVEQVSVILSKHVVISFQERPGDVFDSVRERLRKNKGKIRRAGTDYLAYALLDAIVDSYYAILERVGENIENLEEAVVAEPAPTSLHTIHELKREMIFLRKSVWPLREVISNMSKAESSLVKKATGVYLRDVYDHTIQVIDTVETFRDMLSGMHDTYLSSISNRMNEIMKVLTIFASIFIPLTFIAGIYGMNFANMPELGWRWGYFVVWGVILGVGISMLAYFKKKKWI